MKKILLFAGTTEGRLLTEFLIKKPVLLHVCVATEYGRSLLPASPRLTVSSHRMDSAEMTDFMEKEKFDLIVDATHPYASEVTKSIRTACEQTHILYQRISRDCQSPDTENLFVENIAQAVQFLSGTTGPVFLTTGSKNLHEFMKLTNAADRLFVRILPNAQMLSACHEFGLAGSHIFCMQGPFDTDMNLATIHQIRKIWQKEHPDQADASLYMVTKQSGSTGGFPGKLEAAASAHIPLLVIGRPEDTPGLSLTESYIWLDQWIRTESDSGQKDSPGNLPDQSERTVTLIGTGMSAAQLTIEADEALRHCDVIIGARRMLDMAAHYQKPTYCSYDYPAITAYMTAHTEYRHFAVLFSGDIGFYSGAASLRRCLAGLPFTIRSISGIASPVHFLNTIGKSWEEVHMISCHGQKTSVISHVRCHEKTLILLGKATDAAEICSQLIRYQLSDVFVAVGADLQQPGEIILQGQPKDFTDQSFSALSLIYIENPTAAQETVTHGLSDDRFLRGRVPMTKSEVRSVVLSKLALARHSVLYDIGAGTGSIAIEAARQIPDGHVYAIEKNPEGLALIEQNRLRLQTDNVTIISGTAPECMEELPAATHAFIGGSSGRLADILKLLYSKNPDIRIVSTAITLETIAEIIHLQKEMALPEPEIVQVHVSTAKKAGAYHLMQGQNPVYIITF